MRTIPVGAAVRVRVPASSANLGPGFDSMGLALAIWDEVDVTVTPRPGLCIEVEGSGAEGVPRDESHLVYRSLRQALDHLGMPPPPGLHLVARNAVPHGRGLGSSATAIVTGVVAAQGLCAFADGPLTHPGEPVDVDLRQASAIASDLEGHPDNASAAVYGGLTLSWAADSQGTGPDGTETISLPLHPSLVAVAFIPRDTLATHLARALLPDRVPLRHAAMNSARAALLVEAVTRRPELLVPATRDWLHQEARRPAYAASMALVDELRAAGHAAFISGAGPSVVVLTTVHRSDAVVASATAGDWRRLVPGIPARGATVRAR